MTDISMREMLEAGVHFGHQTRYWNPKMAAYLYGHRNKIHIIDLEKTKVMFQEALNFVGRLSANKGAILFVGTKRAAQQIIREEAQRCEMPYINLRWLGGLLTNYKTVKKSINRLRELEEMKTDGSMERMNKKEALHHQRELEKLERNLAGIKDMEGWPDALFVVDVGYEDIAVSEAVKLKIPVIGVVDSNNSPDGVDYVIPGNDDAIRSIKLYAKAMADAIITGKDSVAHLGEGGDKDEFVELDAEGAPVVKEKREKAQAKEKVQVKKKAARKSPRKTEPAATDGGEETEAAAKPEEAETDSDKEQKSAAQAEEQVVEAAVELNRDDAEESAVSDEDKARKVASHKLVEIAGQRETITYGTLSDWIKSETGILIPNSRPLYDMLDAISMSSIQAGKDMLSAVVVRKDGVPGKGFYSLAQKLGRDTGTSDEEKVEFWKQELNKVYDSYTNQ